MNRFKVLGLAAALVLGMSAMAGAAVLDSDEISVNVTVAQYAEFSLTGQKNIVLNFQEPKDMIWMGAIVSTEAPFSLKTNTNVKITLREDVSKAAVAALGSDKVWGANAADGAILDTSHHGGDWIVGFEPWIEGKGLPNTQTVWRDGAVFQGTQSFYPSSQTNFSAGGSYIDSITLHGTWRNVNIDNSEMEWWKLKSTTNYSGKISVTIEAE